MAITAPDSMAENLMIGSTYKTFWFTEIAELEQKLRKHLAVSLDEVDTFALAPQNCVAPMSMLIIDVHSQINT